MAYPRFTDRICRVPTASRYPNLAAELGGRPRPIDLQKPMKPILIKQEEPIMVATMIAVDDLVMEPADVQFSSLNRRQFKVCAVCKVTYYVARRTHCDCGRTLLLSPLREDQEDELSIEI